MTADASDLTVLIPAYNEEAGIGAALDALLAEPRLRGAAVIVIDDGSSDRTGEIAAERPGVRVLHHKNNQGYGAAIKTGTRRAKTTFVAWFDADGQHRPSDLADMLDAARAKDYDAVFGARAGGSAVDRRRVVGKWVLALAANFVARQKLRDINCGLRVFRRELLEAYLPLLPDGFSASTTSTLLFLHRNRYVTFHAVTTLERAGKSTVKQLRDGMRAIHLLLRIMFLFGAFRVFASAATLFFVTGSAYGLGMAIATGHGIPILGALLVLVGVILFGIGIVSDQVSALRIDLLERSGDWSARTRD